MSIGGKRFNIYTHVYLLTFVTSEWFISGNRKHYPAHQVLFNPSSMSHDAFSGRTRTYSVIGMGNFPRMSGSRTVIRADRRAHGGRLFVSAWRLAVTGSVNDLLRMAQTCSVSPLRVA